MLHRRDVLEPSLDHFGYVTGTFVGVIRDIFDVVIAIYAIMDYTIIRLAIVIFVNYYNE